MNNLRCVVVRLFVCILLHIRKLEEQKKVQETENYNH